jgi:site-specific recombinase XerD
MQNISSTQTTLAVPTTPLSRGLAQDLEVINGGFTDYLLGLGFASFTVQQYQRRLACIAAWLRTHRSRGRIRKLTRQMLPRLLDNLQVGHAKETVLGYRKPLRHWLRFQGRLAKQSRRSLWQPWLLDYLEFLRTHRGVGRSTLEHTEADVGSFLRWQFGRGEADWNAVRTPDI